MGWPAYQKASEKRCRARGEGGAGARADGVAAHQDIALARLAGLSFRHFFFYDARGRAFRSDAGGKNRLRPSRLVRRHLRRSGVDVDIGTAAVAGKPATF